MSCKEDVFEEIPDSLMFTPLPVPILLTPTPEQIDRLMQNLRAILCSQEMHFEVM